MCILGAPVDDCDVATCRSDTSAELVADAAITTSDDNCLSLKVNRLIEEPNDKGSNVRHEGFTRYNAFKFTDSRRS